MPYQTIPIHPAAPAKPPWGAVCNGCGVCCLAEPCPVGVLVSRRRHGACAALQWQDSATTTPDAAPRYVCGLLVDTARYTGLRSHRINRWLRRLASRMISAGRGCDSDAEVLTD